MICSSCEGTSGLSRLGGRGARFKIASKITPEVSPPKGKLAGGHFVKNDAKREKIGTSVEILATNLFG